MFFDFMSKVWDGNNASASAASVISPATPEKKASTMKIANAGFGLSGDGFRQNKVTLRHTLNMTDLSITPPPGTKDLPLPTNVNLDVTLNNLPFKRLVELGKDNGTFRPFRHQPRGS